MTGTTDRLDLFGLPSSANVEASPRRTTDANTMGRINHAVPPVSSVPIVMTVDEDDTDDGPGHPAVAWC
jgi:hypothetical protein